MHYQLKNSSEIMVVFCIYISRSPENTVCGDEIFVFLSFVSWFCCSPGLRSGRFGNFKLILKNTIAFYGLFSITELPYQILHLHQCISPLISPLQSMAPPKVTIPEQDPISEKEQEVRTRNYGFIYWNFADCVTSLPLKIHPNTICYHTSFSHSRCSTLSMRSLVR